MSCYTFRSALRHRKSVRARKHRTYVERKSPSTNNVSVERVIEVDSICTHERSCRTSSLLAIKPEKNTRSERVARVSLATRAGAERAAFLRIPLTFSARAIKRARGDATRLSDLEIRSLISIVTPFRKTLQDHHQPRPSADRGELGAGLHESHSPRRQRRDTQHGPHTQASNLSE